MKPNRDPSTTASITHQYDTMKREAATIICVKAGSSAPKLLKTSSNCGTTNRSRIALTTMATVMIMAG